MTEWKRVEPGDLITADLINAVINELIALDGRLIRLEDLQPGEGPSTGQPVLQRREPAGDAEVGRRLTLIGRNFEPVDRAIAHLGPQAIGDFGPGSNGERLELVVPNLFTGLPRTVNVSVQTPAGTSLPLSVRLLPQPEVNDGEVFVDDMTRDLGTIVEEETYLLRWRVRSETLQPATYDLSLVFSGVEPEELLAEWRDGSRPSEEQREIDSREPLDVQARVRVPRGARTARIALRATSVGGQFDKTSSAVPLTVGEATEGSDPRLVLSVVTQPPANEEGTGFNPVQLADGGTIEVDFGATGSILVKVQPTETGKYTFTREIEGAGSPARWTSARTTPRSLEIIGGQEGDVRFGIRNLGTAADPPPDAVLVARAAKRNEADTEDEYASFTRIPLRGADVI